MNLCLLARVSPTQETVCEEELSTCDFFRGDLGRDLSLRSLYVQTWSP